MSARVGRSVRWGARTVSIGILLVSALSAARVPAGADTVIPLPDGSIVKQLGDGTVVTVSMTGESVNINPSLGGTIVHRNVWTTGHGSVDITGDYANAAVIKLTPGYLIGCQVDIASVTPTGTAGAGFDARELQGAFPLGNTGTGPSAPDLGTIFSALSPLVTGATGGAVVDGNGGSGVTLAPGVARVQPMLDLEQPDDFGNEIHFQFNRVYGPHASVAWTDETYVVDGCAGYAQARSFVLADVETPKARSTVMLWGQPFSMG